jgi:hypothetical protein
MERKKTTTKEKKRLTNPPESQLRLRCGQAGQFKDQDQPPQTRHFLFAAPPIITGLNPLQHRSLFIDETFRRFFSH